MEVGEFPTLLKFGLPQEILEKTFSWLSSVETFSAYDLRREVLRLVKDTRDEAFLIQVTPFCNRLMDLMRVRASIESTTPGKRPGRWRLRRETDAGDLHEERGPDRGRG